MSLHLGVKTMESWRTEEKRNHFVCAVEKKSWESNGYEEPHIRGKKKETKRDVSREAIGSK
jgi:hypothetical protein